MEVGGGHFCFGLVSMHDNQSPLPLALAVPPPQFTLHIGCGLATLGVQRTDEHTATNNPANAATINSCRTACQFFRATGSVV